MPLPYNFLQGLRIIGDSSTEIASNIKNPSFQIGHTQEANHLYTIKDPKLSSGELLLLNQGYDSGWIALCGLRPCPAKHVKVNNWANGWVFESQTSKTPVEKITLFFWPQILQYIGFLALLASFGWVVVKIKVTPKRTPLEPHSYPRNSHLPENLSNPITL